ncbi:MAG: ATP-binding protein, partial [Planctomycetota bacterium]
LVTLGRRMTLTKDTNELLAWVTRAITTNVGAKYVKIFLWDKKQKEFALKRKHGIERRKYFERKLDENDPLIKFLLGRYDTGPVLREEILAFFEKENKQDINVVHNHLRSMGTEVIIPSFIEREMLGFLSLAAKRNGQIYTPEDLDMFKILAGQAALALENVAFYEKQKESQAMLIQASKLSSIGELASGFAHNINNPFNAIMVNADYMRSLFEEHNMENLPEDTKNLLKEANECFNLIIESARAGGSIVSSIRRFSKPSSGDKVPVDLNKIIADAFNLSAPRISESHVKRIVEIPDDPPKLLGDEIQLEQVFMNLFVNAAYAMKDTDREKILKVTARELKDINRIEVTVSDTGAGISKEIKDRIFDYFFTTKRNAGTGLGLALSYQIIQAHNGQIWVESEVNKGTKFIIQLPIATEQDIPD